MSRTTKRNKKNRAKGRAASRFWLTPKAWNKPCSYCEAKGSLAFRHRDSAYACAQCVKARGIVARESKPWREGGARTDPTVTVYRVDPATLRANRG